MNYQDPLSETEKKAIELLMYGGLPSITCSTCGVTSFHGKDIAEGWCNNCDKKIPKTK